MQDPTTFIAIVDIINAGGVVAILLLVLGGFYTGKIMSRKTHEEIEEKQTVIVDKFVDKINGSFITQNENMTRMYNDYTEWKVERRDDLVAMNEVNSELVKAVGQQTTILRSIEVELKKSNNS